MSVTVDERVGVRLDIEARKGATFNRRYHAQFYSGTTLVDYDFAQYTGATLQVRRKSNSPVVELTFSVAAGTITLSGSGRFDLEMDYTTMNNIRGGEYVYDMYLQSTTYPKRDFIYGKFIIYDKITT